LPASVSLHSFVSMDEENTIPLSSVPDINPHTGSFRHQHTSTTLSFPPFHRVRSEVVAPSLRALPLPADNAPPFTSTDALDSASSVPLWAAKKKRIRRIRRVNHKLPPRLRAQRLADRPGPGPPPFGALLGDDLTVFAHGVEAERPGPVPMAMHPVPAEHQQLVHSPSATTSHSSSCSTLTPTSSPHQLPMAAIPYEGPQGHAFHHPLCGVPVEEPGHGMPPHSPWTANLWMAHNDSPEILAVHEADHEPVDNVPEDGTTPSSAAKHSSAVGGGQTTTNLADHGHVDPQTTSCTLDHIEREDYQTTSGSMPSAATHAPWRWAGGTAGSGSSGGYHYRSERALCSTDDFAYSVPPRFQRLRRMNARRQAMRGRAMGRRRISIAGRGYRPPPPERSPPAPPLSRGMRRQSQRVREQMHEKGEWIHAVTKAPDRVVGE